MSEDKPTLLVLAAGMGSRYGGLKQIDEMGPDGEWLLEYAIYDAVQAGFGKVVFVIGRGFATAFKEEWESRFHGVLPMEMVFQEMTDLPEGCPVPEKRTKPLGTGHAIWSAREAVKGPFAVINADDFYGRDAFAKMAKALHGQASGVQPHQFSMVAYPLEKTLSDHGRVSRGVCEVTESGGLDCVREHTHISRRENVIVSALDEGREEVLPADTPVSMNLWGFTTDIFPQLEQSLRSFLGALNRKADSELFIPFVVDELVREKVAGVRVYQTDSPWFGVTYPEDKHPVQMKLQALIQDGQYPSPIWENLN